MLEPFGGRATLRSAPRYAATTTLQIADELGLVGEDGMVLTGIIDDDDAWAIDVVDRVQKRVACWHEAGSKARGVGITFDHGLEWLMYDMVDVDYWLHREQMLQRAASIRSYWFRFLGTSVFVLGRWSDGHSALSRGHSHMEEFLRKNDFDVDVVSTKEPMWLYCRHKQAGSGIQKSKEDDLTISLSDLARRFGLNSDLTSKYLNEADRHGYGIVKRMGRRQARLRSELARVRAEMRSGNVSVYDRMKLRSDEAKVTRELEELSGEVVGHLDAAGVQARPPSHIRSRRSSVTPQSRTDQYDPAMTDGRFNLERHYQRFWRQYRSGRWEQSTKVLMDEMLDKGDLFVDVGAWIGPVSLWALGCGANVIAIEPDPMAVEELRRRVPKSVEVWEGAVSVKSSMGKLAGPPKHHGALGTSMSRVSSDGPIDIQMWTLPEILDGRLPSLVKIDVEGYEVELLPTVAPWLAELGVPLQVALHGVMPDRELFTGYRDVRVPRTATGTLVAKP